jgi:hypothetical protein
MSHPTYNKILNAQIEVWVEHRDDMHPTMKAIGEHLCREWKASIRYINGKMEWQWCSTYLEAVAWCENFRS